MGYSFRVTVQVQRIDEDTGSEDFIGAADPLYECAAAEGAYAFVRSLPGWVLNEAVSSYRVSAQDAPRRKPRQARGKRKMKQ